MTKFTPAQWLLINLASHYGMDKDIYEDRLAWAKENVLPEIQTAATLPELKMNTLKFAVKADVKEEFMAAVLAVWDVCQGRETNYVVGLDACNSGAQVLSALTRCEIGMVNTGLLDTGKRPDLYTVIYKNILAESIEIELDRSTVKDAVVPHLYGSRQSPESIFGEYYPNFLNACKKTMPGLEWARSILINAWNNGALFHEYILPNGSVAHLTSTKKVDIKGKFNGFTYTYRTDVIAAKVRGEDDGTSCLAANVTHSFDAWVLSELDARCNYNETEVREALKAIDAAINEEPQREMNHEMKYMVAVAEKFNIISVASISYIKHGRLAGVSMDYLVPLKMILEDMLAYQSFETKDIHDEFGCHCNHVNRMREHYNAIMAQAYMSTWLYDTIETLTGKSFHHLQPKANPEIVEAIQENNYAIC